MNDRLPIETVVIVLLANADLRLVDDPKTLYRIEVPSLGDRSSGVRVPLASPVFVLQGKSEEQE